VIEEVKALIDSGISPDKLIFYGLEYKFITQYLTGELDYQTMVERLNVAIHQFAKRQMTYFRKMERDGLKINWLDSKIPLDKKLDEIMAKYLQVSDF
jgi:tRNA dimethylallyltransferase